MTYTRSDANQIRESLSHQFPFVFTDFSTLGGEQNASIIIKLSLDDRSTWEYGIFENSRFSIFHLNSQKLEQIARNHTLSKFRKSTVKSNDDLVKKIISWSSKQV